MAEKIYFAHPINAFGHEIQRLCLAAIQNFHPNDEIVNPDSDEHRVGYARGGMSYYTDEVVPGCTALYFLSFSDGRIGAGVLREVEAAFDNDCRVYEFVFRRREVAFVVEHHLRVGLAERGLTVDETRARIRNWDGSIREWER